MMTEIQIICTVAVGLIDARQTNGPSELQEATNLQGFKSKFPGVRLEEICRLANSVYVFMTDSAS